MLEINHLGNLEEREHLFVLSHDTRSLKLQVFFAHCHLHCQTGLTLWSRMPLQTPVFPQLVKKSTMLDITWNLIIIFKKNYRYLLLSLTDYASLRFPFYLLVLKFDSNMIRPSTPGTSEWPLS